MVKRKDEDDDDASVYTVPDDSDAASDDYAESSSSSAGRKPIKKGGKVKRKSVVPKGSVKRSRLSDGGGAGHADLGDIEDTGGMCVRRRHGREWHDVQDVGGRVEDVLEWFEGVREKRGMPWRKRYDPAQSMEEKGQRAYEIWVSEVMLQQTQVATVIAYWKRWIDKWPTIADLARADVEEVNAMWRGLGYYRRARSLLAGAKTVMGHAKYEGRLPDDPLVLEKEIDGVGRYTAGAICSMAYGVRTPIVDGNIHRLLTRLLALHAPQTAPSTIKFLWQAAAELVGSLPDREGVAGDWNQALMELGSQVCKPVAPDCLACPLRDACKAYAELSRAPAEPIADDCDLCAPVPSLVESDSIPSVMVFPMRKEKKASREEEELVCVTEWRGTNGEKRWLFVKRPEKGLLAGLFEPPTTPMLAPMNHDEKVKLASSTLSTLLRVGADDLARADAEDRGKIQHIFSHINMTYHILHLVLHMEAIPAINDEEGEARAVWLDAEGVEGANVGTGVKKVWAEVYGGWGRFDAGGTVKGGGTKAGKKGKGKGKGKGGAATVTKAEGKIVKKVMMPLMPARQR